MQHTLVLNADFSPISCIPISSVSWKDSIKMCWLGAANVVEYYDDWEVHSPSTTLKVPSVIVSTKFMRKKTGIRFSRANLLVRDNFSCQYCNDELNIRDMTIDHVVPRARGGVTRWDNVVASCYTCNAHKGHRISIKPKKPPVKPDYFDLLNNIRKLPIEIPDKEWIPYIGWSEHLITIRPPNKNI